MTGRNTNHYTTSEFHDFIPQISCPGTCTSTWCLCTHTTARGDPTGSTVCASRRVYGKCWPRSDSVHFLSPRGRRLSVSPCCDDISQPFLKARHILPRCCRYDCLSVTATNFHRLCCGVVPESVNVCMCVCVCVCHRCTCVFVSVCTCP